MSLKAEAFRRSWKSRNNRRSPSPITFYDAMTLFAKGFQGRTVWRQLGAEHS